MTARVMNRGTGRGGAERSGAGRRGEGEKMTFGIHFGTFRLADDGQDQPVTDLRAALEAANGDRSRFWVPENGDRRHWR